jgi:hypothetical protein
MINFTEPVGTRMEEEILKTREIIKTNTDIEEVLSKKKKDLEYEIIHLPAFPVSDAINNIKVFECYDVQLEDDRKYFNLERLEIEYAVHKANMILEKEKERRKKEESEALINYFSSEKFDAEFEKALLKNKLSLLNKKQYKEEF